MTIANRLRFILIGWALIAVLAHCAPEPAHAQAGGCTPIPKDDRPVQEAMSPGALAEAFASGGPVIWWRPLANQVMDILKSETGLSPVMPYRAIVVTERHDNNAVALTIYLLSVNLDQLCFAGDDFPAQRYWDWRNALVGRPV